MTIKKQLRNLKYTSSDIEKAVITQLLLYTKNEKLLSYYIENISKVTMHEFELSTLESFYIKHIVGSRYAHNELPAKCDLELIAWKVYFEHVKRISLKLGL